jgi:hypothetical protein
VVSFAITRPQQETTMKKLETKKLCLNKHTLRGLTFAQLADVPGGKANTFFDCRVTNTCTVGCSAVSDCVCAG